MPEYMGIVNDSEDREFRQVSRRHTSLRLRERSIERGMRLQKDDWTKLNKNVRQVVDNALIEEERRLQGCPK